MKQTAKEVRDYLNSLAFLKTSSKAPFKVKIDGPLYQVFDADGLPIAMFSKEIYEMFEEL